MTVSISKQNAETKVIVFEKAKWARSLSGGCGTSASPATFDAIIEGKGRVARSQRLRGTKGSVRQLCKRDVRDAGKCWRLGQLAVLEWWFGGELCHQSGRKPRPEPGFLMQGDRRPHL